MPVIVNEKNVNSTGPVREMRKITIPQMAVQVYMADAFSSRLYILSMGKITIPEKEIPFHEEMINDYLCIYCRRGSGWFMSEKNKYRMKAGDYMITPPGASGRYVSDSEEGWRLEWVRFNGSDAPLVAKPWGETIGECFHLPLKGDDPRAEYRISIFKDLYHSIENGYGMDKMHYITSLLYHYLSSIIYREAIAYSLDTNCFQGIIKKARQYMLDHLDQKITLDDICQYLAISTSYCTAVFNKCTGKTPINYLQSMRVQKAIAMLDSTDMKVNEICSTVGINDPYYFSRLFTKMMGVSPTDYRKKKTVQEPLG